MARPATRRSPGEHLGVLARMLRQIEADVRMKKKRRRFITSLIAKLMRELQTEMVAR